MNASFEQLPIQSIYIKKLKELGFTEPTAIQVEAIPSIAKGKDTIVQSQTGTGKTLAYLLPALGQIDPQQKQLQVLVMVPTRELGMQIMAEIDKLIQGSTIIAQSLIGGAAITRQLDKLRLHPQIVVGTPGRLLELVKLRKLGLHHVKLAIVDEVDQVFELGSMNEVEAIMKGMLRSRQIVFVSATIPESLGKIADKWMQQPVTIRVNPQQRTAETLEHYYFVCEERNKIDTLRRLVRLINPRSAIVFVNATVDIAEVVGKLQYVGLSIEALYGEANKQDRANVMSSFREGKFQLLLATDIAARGLDIEGVTHVFHLDLPINADYYLHRVGRTGRMGRKGTAISIVTPKELFIIDKFEKNLGIKILPKAMYEGQIVDPDQDRSAAAFRSRRANAPTVVSSGRPTELQSKDIAAKAERAKPAGSSERVRPAVKPAAAGVKSGSTGSAKANIRNKAERERERKNKGAPKWSKEKRDKPLS
ncbi:DEAD-box ATP-dependent RNA helicase CshA [compost metagenome]